MTGSGRLTDTTDPCPSRALAMLSAVEPAGSWLRCGNTAGHGGSHQFLMTWEGDPSRERCASEHKGHRCTDEAIHEGLHVVHDAGQLVTWWTEQS